MMHTRVKNNILLALFCCISAISFGQSQTQAKKWFAAKEYAKAKPAFAKLIKSNPKNGSLNYWYGVCLNETGEHEKALPYLKQAVEREVENAFRYMGDYYLEDGKHEEAIAYYENYLNRVSPTDTMFTVYTRKTEKAKNEQKFYKRVEKVIFVDSIVVEKEKFLSAYRLGGECGSISGTKEMLGGNVSGEGIAYRTEMRDKIYYGDIDANGTLQLYMCYKMLDDWSKPTQLNGLPSGDNNYPFLLSDGITIYFANNSSEGMGGYDIYVTRYNSETDRYLMAENIGMPFNSTGNDYMMIIDEINEIGWFATDRNQPTGSVCIYTFIPNTSKQYYNYHEDEFKIIRDAATIKSIVATQTDEEAVRKAKQTLLKLSLKVPDEEEANKFCFVIDDFTDYHSLDDFKSAKARQLYIDWEAKQKALDHLAKQLEEKRMLYLQSSISGRRQMTEELLQMERQHEQLETEVMGMPTTIRNCEINHLKNK